VTKANLVIDWQLCYSENPHHSKRGLPMSWLLFLAALVAGTANPFQSGLNAELNKQTGQPLWASIVVYSTGLMGLLVLLFCFYSKIPFSKAGTVPWWAWPGGLVSVISTVAGLTVAQRLGSGLFTGLSVTGLTRHIGPFGSLCSCRLPSAQCISRPSNRMCATNHGCVAICPLLKRVNLSWILSERSITSVFPSPGFRAGL